MKEVTGILIFICLVVLALYLLVTQRITAKAFIIIGFLAIAAGFTAANYDVIRRFKLKDFELETFEKSVNNIKQEALDALREETQTQRASIGLLLRDADSTREMIDQQDAVLSEQKDALNNLKQAAESLDHRIGTQANQTRAIEKAINQASEALQVLKEHSDFYNLVISAHNDDRRAYDKLKELADNSAFKFQKEAARAHQAVMDAHGSPITFHFEVPWTAGINPNDLTVEQLANGLKATPGIHSRAGILQAIAKRADIPKKRKMEIYIETLTTDESLLVVEYAGRLFESESKDQLKPLAIREHLSWWEKHKSSIPE